MVHLENVRGIARTVKGCGMRLDRLQARLDELGLSANAASQQAGLGRDYVRDLLRGKVKAPTAVRLNALAAALKCSPDYLLGMTPEIGGAPFNDSIRIVFLPVRAVVRTGFFEPDKMPRIASREQFEGQDRIRLPAVSAVPAGDEEWLALVGDAEQVVPRRVGQVHFQYGSFLHVVPPTAVTRHYGIALVEERRGSLLQYSLHDIDVWDGVVSFHPAVAGASEKSWRSLTSGDGVEGVRVVGMVARNYAFFDGTAPFILPGRRGES